MQSFEQYAPTEIVFGKGAEKEAGRLTKKWGGSRVLIVYGGGSAKRSGLLDSIEAELKAEGLFYEELGGVKPNPRLSFAREGVKKAMEMDADFLLAVGGGSAIDTAKAIAMGAANPDTDIWDFWMGKEKPAGSLPIGVVLTIAAAGSETSDSAVLTDETQGKKVGLCSDYNRPKFAVMDPELTYTLPKYQVACGVVDIYMHTLDRYFTPIEGNQLTDEIAEGLMRTVLENGPIVYTTPDDYDAMSEIMWCGSVSHNGITGLGRGRDFSCHKLGHELSGMFDVAHGASLSATWASWARYVYKINPDRFAHYGEKVFGILPEDFDGTPEEQVNAAALAAIDQTEAFFHSLDMPICLGELTGVLPEEDLEKMADSATNGGTKKVATFLPMGREDFISIYQMANHD